MYSNDWAQSINSLEPWQRELLTNQLLFDYSKTRCVQRASASNMHAWVAMQRPTPAHNIGKNKVEGGKDDMVVVVVVAGC